MGRVVTERDGGSGGAAPASPPRSGRRGRAPAALSRLFSALQPPPPALPRSGAPVQRGDGEPREGAERGRTRTPRSAGECRARVSVTASFA